ncbi:MAG TPA: hypothetical protein VK524_13990 [Polyangiaceae bacterium]|nr:hypothetical protein [Polyangiaceae bacterium]
MSIIEYRGDDRRKHRRFVTRNTEYHFRDRTCVAVRDRRSGEWLGSHLALNRSLTGAVRYAHGTVLPSLGEPRIGDALYFGEEGRELVTSLLCAIDRPEKALVASYPGPEGA